MDDVTPVKTISTVVEWNENMNLTKKTSKRVRIMIKKKLKSHRNKKTKKLDTQKLLKKKFQMKVFSYFFIIGMKIKKI